MKKKYNENFQNTARELGWNCHHAQANPHLIIFSYPINSETTYSFTVRDDEEMLANICDRCGGFDADLYIIEQQCSLGSCQKAHKNAETISEEAQTIALKLEELHETLEDTAHDFLVDHLLQAVEDHGWNYAHIGNDMIELRRYTPAGEDFSIAVSRNDAVCDVFSRCINFDEEDHVSMWLQGKQAGVNGVPDWDTLVVDANEIHNMLWELYNVLEVAKTEFYA